MTSSPAAALSAASSAVKAILPQPAPGRGGKALGDGCMLLDFFGVELRVEKVVKLLGVDLEKGFFFGAEAFFYEVDGDLDGGLRRALAVTGLEHVELASFDGELHILHVAEVCFQVVGYSYELLVNLGIGFLEVVDCGRGADTGNDIFALGVHKVLAVELLLAGGGVTGEGNACARSVAHVAEHHRLYIDGGAPIVGDVVHGAVDVGLGLSQLRKTASIAPIS